MTIDTDGMTFEAAFEALTNTVQTLEDETLPLSEMLALYQQGMAFAKQCDVQLEQAELSVKQLLESGEVADFGVER